MNFCIQLKKEIIKYLNFNLEKSKIEKHEFRITETMIWKNIQSGIYRVRIPSD